MSSASLDETAPPRAKKQSERDRGGATEVRCTAVHPMLEIARPGCNGMHYLSASSVIELAKTAMASASMDTGVCVARDMATDPSHKREPPASPPDDLLKAPVLLAEPDDGIAEALEGMLGELGLRVERVVTEALATHQLVLGSCEIAIVDVALAEGRVGAMISSLGQVRASMALIALTRADKTELGVEAVRAGASDFLRMPLHRDEVQWVVRKALRIAESAADESPPSVLQPLTRMIGNSPAMERLRAGVRKSSKGIATVLIRGESGTGKELVARQLHELGDRRSGPFIKMHCAALPDTLLESELFGYEKGAFSGAVSRKAGRVELAEHGTLFLDEIGDVTPATQVKLLRLLQDRQYERLGGTQTLNADVRFVAATHRDLEAMTASGEFRQDLFYRLNVVCLWTPPLRERMEDFETLAIHFCHSAAAANGRAAVALDVEALDLLGKQPWPGNVRHLQNCIERLVVLSSGARISKADAEREIGPRPAPLVLALSGDFAPQVSMESSVTDLREAVQKAERRALEKALRATKGNRDAAARVLRISRRALNYKLREYGIT